MLAKHSGVRMDGQISTDQIAEQALAWVLGPRAASLVALPYRLSSDRSKHNQERAVHEVKPLAALLEIAMEVAVCMLS